MGCPFSERQLLKLKCPFITKQSLQVLEDRSQTIKSERDAVERLLAGLRENVSADQIELARLNTLLESEKSKVSAGSISMGVLQLCSVDRRSEAGDSDVSPLSGISGLSLFHLTFLYLFSCSSA